MSDLLGPIKASSLLGAVKKQLNRVKQKKAVELPLSKREAQRVSEWAESAGVGHLAGKKEGASVTRSSCMSGAAVGSAWLGVLGIF